MKTGSAAAIVAGLFLVGMSGCISSLRDEPHHRLLYEVDAENPPRLAEAKLAHILQYRLTADGRLPIQVSSPGPGQIEVLSHLLEPQQRERTRRIVEAAGEMRVVSGGDSGGLTHADLEAVKPEEAPPRLVLKINPDHKDGQDRPAGKRLEQLLADGPLELILDGQAMGRLEPGPTPLHLTLATSESELPFLRDVLRGGPLPLPLKTPPRVDEVVTP